MAISSILRQILYLFNTTFLLVNFAFVKKETPKKGGGRPPLRRSATALVLPSLMKTGLQEKRRHKTKSKSKVLTCAISSHLLPCCQVLR